MMAESLIETSGSNEGCQVDTTPSTTTRKPYIYLHRNHVELTLCPTPPVPRFPQEIVDAILDEIGDDTEVLRQCRLVCHAMSNSARPRMHRRIVLTSAQQCQNFYRLCCDTEDIPGLVRELWLQGDEQLSPSANDNIINAQWPANEPSLPAVLTTLRHIQRLRLAFIMWNGVSTSLAHSYFSFVSMRGWSDMMNQVSSFMRKAPHLRDFEIRDSLCVDITWPSEGEGPAPNIESLCNHSGIAHTTMPWGGLAPLSFHDLKRLSIHLPIAFHCVVVEEMVYSGRDALEELTLAAPRQCTSLPIHHVHPSWTVIGFGVDTDAEDVQSDRWIGQIPTSHVHPSRIPLRVLRFQMVDRHDERDSAATDPLEILICLTQFFANETRPIGLEHITIEVILTNPESCLNNEVWRNWDGVLSRNNVHSLKSVHVTLRGPVTQRTLRRMDHLRQGIISSMAELNSKGVLRVDAPHIV
ncbi:hypothetical protein BDZ89DRAFT_1171095 [Hymenopellis radicata]|nr:hypothetical protein BDZ89DRAFT_1171095 [Hymenopellis radicata]